VSDPIFAARHPEATDDPPWSRPPANTTRLIVSVLAPNLRVNQKTTKVVTTKPPAKASRPKSAASFCTVRRDDGLRGGRAGPLLRLPCRPLPRSATAPPLPSTSEPRRTDSPEFVGSTAVVSRVARNAQVAAMGRYTRSQRWWGGRLG